MKLCTLKRTDLHLLTILDFYGIFQSFVLGVYQSKQFIEIKMKILSVNFDCFASERIESLFEL